MESPVSKVGNNPHRITSRERVVTPYSLVVVAEGLNRVPSRPLSQGTTYGNRVLPCRGTWPRESVDTSSTCKLTTLYEILYSIIPAIL